MPDHPSFQFRKFHDFSAIVTGSTHLVLRRDVTTDILFALNWRIMENIGRQYDAVEAIEKANMEDVINCQTAFNKGFLSRTELGIV